MDNEYIMEMCRNLTPADTDKLLRFMALKSVSVGVILVSNIPSIVCVKPPEKLNDKN